MKNVDVILERFRENEELGRKFHEVETDILSILNFKDLFEVLLSEIGEKIAVPLVWFSIIEKSEILDLVKSSKESEALQKRINVIEGETFAEVTGGRAVPVLTNRIRSRHLRLLPKGNSFLARSMAILPIALDGQVVGSLNLADFSSSRFSPDLDSIFLERLAVKVSICLSNVTAHEKLKYVAHHDPLTGLVNRRLMERLLKQEFKRCRRYGSPLSLVFIDLDDFKLVNDRFGHDVGDLFLKHVADGMVETCRKSDIVVRFAGDEFVILLPETTMESARELMARLEESFEKNPFSVENEKVFVGMSYGVVSLDEDVEDHAALLKRADALLYRNKGVKKPGNKDEGEA